MTEFEARQVLLLRAVEQVAVDPPDDVVWSAADAAWASAQARRELGEYADGEVFLAQRARLGLGRLAARDRRWRDALLQAAPSRAKWVLGLLILALLAGLLADVLGPASHLNLLAPPRLALLLWNVLVYAGLLVVWLSRARSDARAPAWPLRLADAWQRWAGRRARPGWAAAVRTQFLADWWLASRGLQQQRATAALHAAAAVLALGLVLSMYLHGLVFDYRAGWDSTFLDAAQVHALLSFVLGPALALSGLELPSVPALAALRWADGGAGEGAARWIHWYALTLGAVVVLPRLLLAAWALAAAWRAARCITLPLDDPYFRRLVREGAPVLPRPANVLPYSYRLGAAQRAGLATVLSNLIGPGAQPLLAEPLPLGVEDDLAERLPAAPTDIVVALMALTATPERETHGAFLRALAAALPARCTLHVLVDESGFRLQFGASADGPLRLQQRHQAWRQLLQDMGLPAPHFADLAAPQSA